jgi:hypothetical protein
MGFFSNNTNKNGTDTVKEVVNVEWVLKTLDILGTVFSKTKNGLVPQIRYNIFRKNKDRFAAIW